MIASVAAPLLTVRWRAHRDHRPRGSESRTLLEELSFEVAAGEFVAVVGESGSGKTLAARSILSLLPAGVRQTAGRIELEGRDLTQLSAAGDAQSPRRADRDGVSGADGLLESRHDH